MKISSRWLLYGIWIGVSILILWKPAAALAQFAYNSGNSSYILLVPLISAGLLFSERKRISCRVFFDFPLSLIFLLCALAAFPWVLKSPPPGEFTALAFTLGFTWIAGFALFFGREALQAGRFPFAFLLLMVPLPEALLNPLIYLLQKGSAEVCLGLFDMAGVPVLREGFVFHLPRVSIEVARECSGIRSSMALFILALLLGHVYLHKLWTQIVFVLFVILVTIVKNGIRIVTLSLLAIYVDPGFLYGRLHRSGGFVFFLLGALLLLPLLWALRRGETVHIANARSPS